MILKVLDQSFTLYTLIQNAPDDRLMRIFRAEQNNSSKELHQFQIE